ncbi:uncharacterized protein B4U79_17945 [Dinothrombium tinctorium]|uniref:Protein AMN1-like protein n=1 Tax=Dinothrombium tinctorium TaxID=1965070 RepID=A0A443RFW1_9ACAR|nr:uncharacterized protein B4U79_17945 [Dinothrombium tinctorium]
MWATFIIFFIFIKRICKSWQFLSLESIKHENRSICNPEDIFSQYKKSKCGSVETVITSQVFTTIIKLCTKLREFNNEKLNEYKIRLELSELQRCLKQENHFISPLKNLSFVNLKSNIDENGLAELFRRCPQLKHFQIKSCTAFTGHSLHSLNLNLISLSIEDCPNVKVQNLIEFISKRRFNLISFKLGRNCIKTQNISNKNLLLNAITKCSSIKELTVAIDSVNLSKIGRLKQLETLTIRTSSIGDEVFKAIIACCRNLKCLKLNLSSFDTELSDRYMQRLPDFCPHLEEVAMYGCDKVCIHKHHPKKTGSLILTVKVY